MRHGFLDPNALADLLEYAVSHEADFTPARLGSSSAHGVDASVRVSSVLRDFGDHGEIFGRRVAALAPEFARDLQMSRFVVSDPEVELVAHGHGAFFKRHVDIAPGRAPGHIRILSSVYYFNAEPKAFTGGALRLHAIGSGASEFVDVEPICNSLVVFPSWAPHEVLPVVCPSGRFVDSRFAVNCWIRGTPGGTER